MKWAFKNGICAASKRLDNETESNQLSTALVNCIGKQCMVYTSTPIDLQVNGDFNTLWKLECEILEVDHQWIRIRYEKKQQLVEKVIRLNQLKSVDIL